MKFSISINAPVAKVRDCMLSDKTYRERTKPFNPAGSWFEGDRSQGSKILFLGPDQEGKNIGGMYSEIVENRKYEFVSIKHLGEMMNGEAVLHSERKDAFENYTFTEKDGVTTVLAELNMDSAPADMMTYMEQTWPEALKVLKEICER